MNKKKKRKILHLLITPVIESSPGLDLRQHLWIPYPGDMETMGNGNEGIKDLKKAFSVALYGIIRSAFVD